MTIQFCLPFLPFSKSNGYRAGKGRFFKATHIKEQEQQITAILTAVLPFDYQVMEGPVKLTAHFKYPDKRRRDLDGHLKLLLDCMNGLIFKDDSQVVEIHAIKTLGCTEASSQITVEELLNA